MLQNEAEDLAQSLRRISAEILSRAGIPSSPMGKTRQWANRKFATGVAYHWTGGPSLMRTARWFNTPSYGNTGSSCHFLIGDDLSGLLGELWLRYAVPEIGNLFDVPTLQLASLDTGTWCTNWTNDRTLGVELRNLGPVQEGAPDKARHAQISGRIYERYTVEQLRSALNVGRMAKALAGDSFEPEWVIGHSMVNAVKSDPGPDFPLHAMRRAIIRDDLDVQHLSWLRGYPYMFESAISIAPTRTPDVERDDTPFCGPVLVAVHSEDAVSSGRERWVSECLYRMGFHCGPQPPTPAELRKFVVWFQISTQKWKTGKLRHTGQITPGTITAIKRRMGQLRLPIPADE